jgi:hypothetical protein
MRYWFLILGFLLYGCASAPTQPTPFQAFTGAHAAYLENKITYEQMTSIQNAALAAEIRNVQTPFYTFGPAPAEPAYTIYRPFHDIGPSAVIYDNH